MDHADWARYRLDDFGAAGREAVQAREALTDIIEDLRPYAAERDLLYNAGKSGIISLPDSIIGRSLGAARKAYDIMDLATGEHFDLADNTHLENVRVFAGKGAKEPYRKAWKYVKKHPDTRLEDWQHVKGIGTIDYYGEPRRAEIHWSQNEETGIDDMFVKEWLE